jgi:Ser/Thr protein kinase RdoA (MazF antagonist)
VTSFANLTPERILDAVEAALGARATGRCLALNSLENRVYDVELEEGGRVVAKFYRPGRWSTETILEEHRFLGELAEAEVPVAAPLPVGGGTLGFLDDGMRFAVFPRVRGRCLVELEDDRLAQVGRLLGRLHNVGARTDAPHRTRLSVESHGRAPLAVLLASGRMEPAPAERYRHFAEEIFRRVEPALARARAVRIHGDCHLGNVLWDEGGPFFVDFDDLLVGPAVQDVWMVVRGRGEEADRRRDRLLEGYAQMREFDRSELPLVEGLRALRMIHYAAWICRRWEDPTFQRTFPDFGGARYWAEEIAALDEQLELIAGADR